MVNKENIDVISEEIRATYEEIRGKRGDSARKAGVDPASIQVVAVTKSHSPVVIDAGLRAGIRIIGENKVQEAESKLPLLQEKFAEFHFIGHLQKNKINKLLPLHPTLIHSIDKLSTAQSLEKSLEREEQQQKILIQVNTSGEESKSGLPADYEQLRETIYQISLLKRLQIKGLMTIGKFTENEKEVRECFALLRRFYEKLRGERIAGVEMEILSMGMTDDYQLAVEEGATMLRIGTALFGKRLYSKSNEEN